MGKGTKDPQKPSKAYLQANPGSSSQIPPEASKAKGKGRATKPSSEGNAEHDLLRQAIKDLGGDDEDFELVKGVDSDAEEVEDAPAKGKQHKSEAALKSELSKFLKGLDFAKVAPAELEAAEDEEEDEEEEVEDDENEDEDLEEDSEEELEEESESEAEEEDEEPTAPLEEAKPEFPAFKIKSGLQASSDARVDNIPQTPTWYDIPVPAIPESAAPLAPLPPAKLSALQSRANTLLESLHNPKSKLTIGGGKSSSDNAFLSQILSDGTHQDKLSALILLVRESPIHRMAELERLRSMAGWSATGAGGGGIKGGGGREEKIAVMRALSDWWVAGGGKEQGKLRYFADQPLLAHPAITDRHLVLFAFEDWLKKWFFTMLQVLETFLHDTLPFVRTQALAITFKLLAGNAEQEQNLLRLGVNKLGDTDKSVASKASHHILMLLQTHPAMKAVIVREVAALVLKAPATGPEQHKRFDSDKSKGKGKGRATPHAEAGANHGRYYGLITLNQVTLTVKDREVAARLVEVYFEIFKELLDTDKDHSAPIDGDDAEQQKLEKVTGKVNKWQGRHKGTKFTKNKAQQEEEELEHDGKLIAALLTGVNRALPFAKLDDSIFAQHAETLFRITHVGTFNTSIRALMLIHQVAAAKESVSDRFYRTLYQSMLDPRLTESSKQAMYLNLLFKAIKADTSIGRVMAFVKRLLQIMTLHQPPFICGAMFLLGELFSNTAGLRTLLNEPEDNGIEHFQDVQQDGDVAMNGADNAVKPTTNSVEYDGRKRDPQHANAQGSCLWELVPFLSHYHPSVSLQATQLLSLNLPLSGSPDISQNTLISFLDRFVYRNPKKHAMAKGASIMQPAAVSNGAGLTVVKNRGPRVGGENAVEAGYVNDEKFWSKKVQDVPADQLFFHKYFNLKLDKQKALEAHAAKRKKGKKGADSELGLSDEEEGEEEEEEAASDEDEAESSSGKKGKRADDESEESDPEEAEIWKAMQASMPQTLDDDLMDESGSDEFDEEDMEDMEDLTEDEDAEGKISDDDESDDEGFPMGEDSDDLLSESEMPDIPLVTGDSEDEERSEDEEQSRKRKRREDNKERRKKRKALPLLASAEDYAALIDGADEENL